VEDRSNHTRTSEYAGPSVTDGAHGIRSTSVRTGGPSPTKSVELLVAEGMSRLSAERAVAIREGAAEPSRARRHGRSGL